MPIEFILTVDGRLIPAKRSTIKREKCPDCGGKLNRIHKSRHPVQEIWRCRDCKKKVEQ